MCEDPVEAKNFQPSDSHRFITPEGISLLPTENVVPLSNTVWGNTERVVEEGSYKYQLRPCDQLQK